MTREPDGLAELLPRWHRLRDAEQGEPLRALLAVLAEQADRVRDGVAQCYDDWFVETAADWVLPYLGDLVGYRPLSGYERVLATGLRDGGPPDASRQRLARALAPRRDVARTVGYRRRKGALHLLEELADSVAGWPARAVELSRLPAHTQPVRLYGPGRTGAAGGAAGSADALRAGRGRLADLRDGAALDLAETPFSAVARSVDVRRAASARRARGLTPAGVALHVWRLRARSVTRAPAYCVDRARHLFTFSVLGNDTALATRPEPEPAAAHLATLDNVPAAVRRRQFADRPGDYYGPGKSLTVWRDGSAEPVPLADIVVADLSGWRYRPRRGQVAIDPELGRIAFAARSAPRHGVRVTYHHLAADDLGGGEYPRERDTAPGARVYRVGPGQRYERIMDAYADWRRDRAARTAVATAGPEAAGSAAAGPETAGPETAEPETAGRPGPEGVIEITHSGAYQEQLDFDLAPGDRLTLRAAEGTRPVIRLLDWYSNRPDALNIRAEEAGSAAGPPPSPRPGAAAAPRMVLDGLLITGRGVHVGGPVGTVALRHCTLVPGWSLEPDCTPASPAEPSLVLERTTARVEIDRCVLGSIEVLGDEVGTDPLPLHLRDSVLDATAHHRQALSAPDCRHAHAVLHAHRVTVIGEVFTHAVRIAENSLFTARLHVARRQPGCLRYCYVPPGSRTPRRHRCLPEDPRDGLRPVFAGERYGTADHARLADGGPWQLRRGAEDGAELGAFHDLYQPQREDSLRARLAEYTPADADAGIFFAT